MHSQVGIVTVLLSAALGLPTRQQRLSLAEWGSYSFRDHKGPGTYAFGYDIEDPVTNNIQFRQEERHVNGSVTGSYGYVEPTGHVRIMHYIADTRGYRVHEESPSPIHLPHHDVTTQPPLHQQDEQIFEGEFTPVTEDVENDLEYPDNTYPIQFPAVVQLPPPVHDEDNFRPQNHFSNDVSNSLFAGPSHPLQKPSLRPQSLVPTRFHSNSQSTSNFVNPAIQRAPMLIYQSPWGGYRGAVKFKVQ